MSRAFVKEDTSEVVSDLPERPVSEHPNYVTAEGLAQIESEVARLRQELAAATASADRSAQAKIGSDLRYWTARRANAELVPPPADCKTVRFGCAVTILREDGRKQTFKILGEDEADPAKGTLSHAAPLARSLLGKSLQESIQAGHGKATIVFIAPG